jgi:hypothetical protein
MGDSIYQAFAVSVLRTGLKVAGGALVARGLVDDGLMQEVAAGLAIVIVTQAWDFWRIHKRELHQRWLVVLGLRASPYVQPSTIVEAAKERTRAGIQPYE